MNGKKREGNLRFTYVHNACAQNSKSNRVLLLLEFKVFLLQEPSCFFTWYLEILKEKLEKGVRWRRSVRCEILQNNPISGLSMSACLKKSSHSH